MNAETLALKKITVSACTNMMRESECEHAIAPKQSRIEWMEFASEQTEACTKHRRTQTDAASLLPVPFSCEPISKRHDAALLPMLPLDPLMTVRVMSQ